ncbi:MAG: esterase/lipase family protein [Candidatus Polarisedimenticolia bacterium]
MRIPPRERNYKVITGSWIAMALVSCAALAACAEMGPNLLEVYPDAAARRHRPVIIVPGAFGSRLRNVETGEVVWGRFSNLLSSRFKLILNPSNASSDLLDLPIDSADLSQNRDNLVAYSLFDEVGGRAFYRAIVRTLTDVAGYKVGDIENPQPDQDCFAFYYDWRRDIPENARLLGEAIDRVLAARPGGDGRVDIIAHSLGGLVTRYYLKYGVEDVAKGQGAIRPTNAGARRIETVVLLGVPSEGSLDTFTSLNEGWRLVRRLPAELIFTMPAAYQGLPHPESGPFIDANGTRLDVDLYDPAVWEEYGWSIFSPARLESLRQESRRQFDKGEAGARYSERLERMRAFLKAALARARRVHLALDTEDRESADGTRVFAFGGDCIPTPARAMILPDGKGRFRTVMHLDDVPDKVRTQRIARLMSEPGDGSVTRGSLLAMNTAGAKTSPGLKIDYALFLCDRHRNLTENVTFQDNLLHFLLYNGHPMRTDAAGGAGSSK